jgi:hypothetical protein
MAPKQGAYSPLTRDSCGAEPTFHIDELTRQSCLSAAKSGLFQQRHGCATVQLGLQCAADAPPRRAQNASGTAPETATGRLPSMRSSRGAIRRHRIPRLRCGAGSAPLEQVALRSMPPSLLPARAHALAKLLKNAWTNRRAYGRDFATVGAWRPVADARSAIARTSMSPRRAAAAPTAVAGAVATCGTTMNRGGHRPAARRATLI